MHGISLHAASHALLAELFDGPVAASLSLVLVNGKLFDGQATGTAVTASAVGPRIPAIRATGALGAVPPRRPVLLRAFREDTTVAIGAGLVALGVREDAPDRAVSTEVVN